MKLSQFKFKLPEELIALNPPYHRDECKLMVIHKQSQTIDMYQKDKNGKTIENEDGSPVFMDFRNVLNYFDEGEDRSISFKRAKSRYAFMGCAC